MTTFCSLNSYHRLGYFCGLSAYRVSYFYRLGSFGTLGLSCRLRVGYVSYILSPFFTLDPFYISRYLTIYSDTAQIPILNIHCFLAGSNLTFFVP